MKLAREISGAGEAEEALLELLCGAAEQAWTARLREGVAVEDCGGAFACAAAMTAAAALAAGRSGKAVSGFTAGEVSVRVRDAGSCGEDLRQAAERLMAPYAAADDFAFQGVSG